MAETVELNNQGIRLETILKAAFTVPGVQINRQAYLYREFRKYGSHEQASRAVETTPKEAGYPQEILARVAKGCIKYETSKVTALSAVAGMPGGVILIGTIPADLAQYYAHILRVLQKLAYIYGWDDLRNDSGQFDDETMNTVMLFMGVMFGVDMAASALSQLAEQAALTALKRIPRMALTKTAYYPIIKNIACFLGVRMNRMVFARGISKIIPVIGAVTSGGLTLVTFRSMALRLDDELRKIAFQI